LQPEGLFHHRSAGQWRLSTSSFRDTTVTITSVTITSSAPDGPAVRHALACNHTHTSRFKLPIWHPQPAHERLNGYCTSALCEIILCSLPFL
jgi:hypothetical protein